MDCYRGGRDRLLICPKGAIEERRGKLYGLLIAVVVIIAIMSVIAVIVFIVRAKKEKRVRVEY